MKFLVIILLILFIGIGDFLQQSFKEFPTTNHLRSDLQNVLPVEHSTQNFTPEKPAKQIIIHQNVSKKYIYKEIVNEPHVEKKFIPRNDSFLSDDVRKNRSIIYDRVGENYIDSILSNGKLVRWNPATFPLSVYIENSPNLPPYYYSQIKKAFERWQSVSDNFITFKFTDIKEGADIICTFPVKFERKCGVSNVAAWHKYFYENNMIKYSDIQFAKVSCQKSLYSAEFVYATALHEIGHSLGLNGHSSNPDDLMYPVSSKTSDISDSDIRTLKLVYSIVPHITNTPLSQLDTKTLITPDDVWGSEEGRIEMQLQDIKDKINNISGISYSEYVKMGELYFQKGDYVNAIESFNNALNIATNKSNLSAINRRISAAYVKMNKNKEALPYAQKAYELNPDADGIVYIASIHYELGHYQEAKTMLRNLLNQNPKIYNAYKILCNIYLKEKDYEAAKALYERGKKQFPKNPPIKLKSD